MDSLAGYAQDLRSIGQALEILKLGDFTVEPQSDGYRVTGTPLEVKSGRSLWWNNQSSIDGNLVELLYSKSDVERLESEGRNQRAKLQGNSDCSRLSQALRVLGSYLTQKYCRLVRLSRKDENFEVEYESSLGSHYSEQLSGADLYGLWVRFYLKRSVRTQ